MSGGHFDYNQHLIEDIAVEIERVIANNNIPNEYGEYASYSEDTIRMMREGVIALRGAAVYAERIDYLLCGDDGEESFHKRLPKDLEAVGFKLTRRGTAP